MEKDLITIVAPAYNHAAYIENALRSIQNQTYVNKELIVIDDCSTDHTAAIIDRFVASEDVQAAFPGGIRFIRHAVNMNAHNSLNEGICEAQGKYIAIINTDDMYEDNRLECMLNELKLQGGRFAFSNVRIMNQYGEIKDYEPFEKMLQKIEQYPRISMILPIENMSISTGNYLFDKKLYEEIGGFNAEYHFIHDWDFVLRSCLIAEPVFVKDTTYLYRFHETNTIKQIDESYTMQRKKEKEVYAVLYNYLKKIKSKEYCNQQMVSEESWTYFLNHKQICYASGIWNDI